MLDRTLNQENIHPKAEQPANIWSWLDSNVVRPAVNSGIIEPLNVASNVVNGTVGRLVHKDIIGKLEHLAVPEAACCTLPWAAQTISGGLAGLIPYTLAGKAASVPLRAAGFRLTGYGAVTGILKSEHTAQIAGAALYDGLRDARARETHLSNALSGALAFGIFHGGNTLSKDLPLLSRIPALSLTGAAGASTQATTSRLWATHELPTAGELMQASLSGAFMNLALPATQRALSSGISSLNMRAGRGEPLDRYLAARSTPVPSEIKFIQTAVSHIRGQLSTRLAWMKPAVAADAKYHAQITEFQEATDNSSLLRSLALTNETIRVLETERTNAYLPASKQVLLGRDSISPENLAHELTHAEQVKSQQFEQAFVDAQWQLASGNKEAARQTYWTARVESELSSELAAAQVHEQRTDNQHTTANDKRPSGPESLPDTAQSAETVAALRKRIESNLREQVDDEFEKFVQSKGTYRPEIFFKGKASANDRKHWQKKLDDWHSLSQKDKLSTLRELQDAPPRARADIILKALLDPGKDPTETSSIHAENKEWSIREGADARFFLLAAADRIKVWHRLLSSKDYFVRLLALSHIGDLPAEYRLAAFRHVLQDRRALVLPETSNYARLFPDKEYRPSAPGWHNNTLKPTLEKLPAELLVESIASLPLPQRLAAWNQAFDHQQLSSRPRYYRAPEEVREHPAQLAALSRLYIVPKLQREVIWNKLWTQFTDYDHDSMAVDILVQQIAHLPEDARPRAFHKLFATSIGFSGEVVEVALASLGEADRLPAWQKLLARSNRTTWASERTKYSADYEADCALASGRETGNWQNFDRWVTRNQQLGIDNSWQTILTTSTEHLNRGLGLSISALPEQFRLKAWIDVARLDPAQYMVELAKAIPSLPENAQSAAMRWFIKTSAQQQAAAERLKTQTSWMSPQQAKRELQSLVDSWQVRSILKQTPLKLFPEIAREALALPDSPLQAALLNNLPIDKYSQGTPLESAAALHNLFDTACKAAGTKGYEYIARWWTHIVEPAPSSTLADNDIVPTPVHDHLTHLLDPTYLGRLLTSRTDLTAFDRLSLKAPSIVRALSRSFSGNFSAEDHLPEERRLAELARTWDETGSTSAIAELACQPITVTPNRIESPDYALSTQLVGELADISSSHQRAEALDMLTARFFDRTSPACSADTEVGIADLQLRLPALIAAQIGKIDPAALEQHFVRPVAARLHDRHSDYNWRLTAAREIASLQREHEIPAELFQMPDLRMPKISGLAEAEKVQLRTTFQDALFDTSSIRSLWSNGKLGQLFPDLFGSFNSDGGIVGRPQHGGHEFTVDEHTLRVMQNVQQHPLFETLSQTDQENLLAAASMHDVGKRANMLDLDHEWVSANIAWGVLTTLGFTPVRSQRICNLIARHNEVSFVPAERVSQKLSNPAHLDDLATFYRHPAALKQLRILNEADIKSIDGESSLWTQPVESELNLVTQVIGKRSQQLNENQIPILTTELPTRFGLVKMDRPYALLGHISGNLHDSFLKQLSTIESREYSISSTLITNEHQKFFYDGQPVFALIEAPWEQISQAYRDNLGTGVNVDWREHVELSKNWLERQEGTSFASEINTLANGLGIPKSLSASKKGHLASSRQHLAQFDSLNELLVREGPWSRYTRLQQSIHHALTTDKHGEPLSTNNEVKINNPTIGGLGILRKGKPVYFENLSDQADLSRLLDGQERPKWLVNGSGIAPPKNAIAIPESTWRTLVNRDLPIVVLDP